MSLTSKLSLCGRTFMSGSLFVLISATQMVHASSADAWQEFQQDVEKKCRLAAKDLLDAQVVQVDPYGSESNGFAILVGPDPTNAKLIMVVCAYDKQTQVAEVSGAFNF